MPWKKGNRLRAISEAAADEPTHAVFTEIRQALGLPALWTFYPALAAYPEFLRRHWNMVKPVVESAGFFACADRLRADADTRAHNYLRVRDLSAGWQQFPGARQELSAALDLFHYRDPLLLLLFSAQVQALETAVGQSRAERRQASHPVYTQRPLLVDEENASGRVRHRYEEIRRVLQLPYVNAEFQAMARFPDFLDAYWELLKALCQSPVYQECQYGIQETAWSLARELPGPMELSVEQLLDAGMTPEDVASVTRILQLFVRNLSGLLLNVAIAKIALEGGNLSFPHEPKASPGAERVA